MDLWEPRASVLLRPGASQALAQASAASPTADGCVTRLWIPTEQGTVCVTPPTTGTLADLRWDLSPEQAMDLARWLGPAILDPRGTQRDRIRPEDIVLDEAGVPRLMGLGLPAAEAVLEIPHYTAPEVLARRPPTAASGLYGLGVLLYRGLTGAWPVPARNLQDLLDRGAAPVRPSALRPDLPPTVDAVVAGLLSADPAARVEALRALGPAPAVGPILGLARLADGVTPRPQAAPPPLATTVTPPALRSGPHLVLTEVRGLPPAARFLVATLAGVPLAVVEAAAGRRQAIAVGALATSHDAERMVAHLGQLGLDARVAPSLGQGRGLLGLLALASIACAAVAVMFSTLAALALAAVGFAFAVFALLRPPAALRGGAMPGRHERQEAAALARRVASLAIRIVDAGLPGPVARDLRDDLYDVSLRIDELCAARDGLTRALRAIDHADAGEPLRRSVAVIDRQLDDLGDVLDEVETALAAQRAEAGPAPSDAAERIHQRLAALRAARTELELTPDAARQRQAATAAITRQT